MQWHRFLFQVKYWNQCPCIYYWVARTAVRISIFTLFAASNNVTHEFGEHNYCQHSSRWRVTSVISARRPWRWRILLPWKPNSQFLLAQSWTKWSRCRITVCHFTLEFLRGWDKQWVWSYASITPVNWIIIWRSSGKVVLKTHLVLRITTSYLIGKFNQNVKWLSNRINRHLQHRPDNQYQCIKHIRRFFLIEDVNLTSRVI